ncbi:response regulator transcription factor [Streptomyces sp. 6N223]|uniref:response regulator transcription factor n=1 Tax=Streptomyces sp. 6N223 TaxID=3457412 RepID=UPI003FCFB5AE
MAALTERDYDNMLDLATDVLSGRAGEPPWPRVLAELGRALHAPRASLTRANWTRREGRPVAWSPASLDERRMAEVSRRLMLAGHPLARHYATRTDAEPRTAAEVAGETAWRGSRAASLSREYFDAGHVLGIPLPAPAGTTRGFVAYHADADGDFTERERAYARRVRPLLVAVDAHQQQLERWRSLADAGAAAGLDELAREHNLTPREITVLTLLADSLPATAIGRRLGISPRTVHKHVEHLYRKLKVTDRLSAVLRAQSFGLLPKKGETSANASGAGANSAN